MNLKIVYEMAAIALHGARVASISIYPNAVVMAESGDSLFMLFGNGKYFVNAPGAMPLGAARQKALATRINTYLHDNRYELFLLQMMQHMQAFVHAENLRDYHDMLAQGLGKNLPSPGDTPSLHVSWACALADAVAGQRYALRALKIHNSKTCELLLNSEKLKSIIVRNDGNWYCVNADGSREHQGLQMPLATRYARLLSRSNAQLLALLRQTPKLCNAL